MLAVLRQASSRSVCALVPGVRVGAFGLRVSHVRAQPAIARSVLASNARVARAFATETKKLDLSKPLDTFVRRHLGPTSEADLHKMYSVLKVASVDEIIDKTVPKSIKSQPFLKIGPQRGEAEMLAEFKQTMSLNKVARSHIGTGYYDTITPGVILRNILENPGWYTPYTPYQAEVSQGRLEMLLNFQTMVCDLTGLPFANASLLDEATSAAEAMSMCLNIVREKDKNKHTFLVDVANGAAVEGEV